MVIAALESLHQVFIRQLECFIDVHFVFFLQAMATLDSCFDFRPQGCKIIRNGEPLTDQETRHGKGDSVLIFDLAVHVSSFDHKLKRSLNLKITTHN